MRVLFVLAVPNLRFGVMLSLVCFTAACYGPKQTPATALASGGTAGSESGSGSSGTEEPSRQVLERSETRVSNKGLHEQRIEYTTTVMTADVATLITNSYVQLETGLNRWDSNLKEFVAASAAIEIVNGSGIVRNAQYQAVFSQNANDPAGLLDLHMPGGERLITQPIGLALTEPDTGKSVFLGELKDSQAVLLDANTIVYPDAFDGFNASIIIKTRLSGIESDVVLQENLDANAVLAFGFDPATVRLEIWHQILSKPDAQLHSSAVERLNGSVDFDKAAFFSAMAVGPGTAFSTGEAESPDQNQIRVTKEWSTLEGMDFLIESIPFNEAAASLENLPERPQARIIDKPAFEQAIAARQERANRNQRETTSQHNSTRLGKPISQATYVKAGETYVTSVPAVNNSFLKLRTQTEKEGTDLARLTEGFLIDFPVTLTTQTDFTFKGDTTYWVTGAIDLYGTTTVEGGTVVKYTNYTSLNPVVTVRGPFNCETSPYNIAIFTAEDDNTVGETIASSSGTPLTGTFYAWYNLRFLTSVTNTINVHDIQSRYAHVGVFFSTPGISYVWNATIYNCDRGIESQNSDITAMNILLNRTRYAVNFNNISGKVMTGEHFTVNSAQKLFNTGLANSMYLTNSLLCNITNTSSPGVSSNTTYEVMSNAFVAAGRGNHYLSDHSYRNIASTNVSSYTKTLLASGTTYAPLLLTNDFSVDTTLVPILQRDTDAPDLGYHYPPLDFLMGDRHVTNAILTLTNGVAVGLYGTNGIILRNGSQLHSTGRPNQMNTLVRYQSVQEDSSTALGAVNETAMSLVNVVAPTSDPAVSFRFTRVNLLANTAERRAFVRGAFETELVSNFTLMDCHFANTRHQHSATTSGSATSIRWFNNVFLRPDIYIYSGASSPYYPLSLEFSQNLMRNGIGNFQHHYASFTINDNLFDTCTLTGGSVALSSPRNAYKSTTPLNGNQNDRTIAACDFIAGPLGSYYYPTAGGNLFTLIDAGNRTAAQAGLTHFTTSAIASSKDASTVDMGFHYASTSSDGTPLDSDTDGIPDYIEDADGDGVLDSGESSSTNGLDQGFQIFITQPKSHSNVF